MSVWDCIWGFGIVFGIVCICMCTSKCECPLILSVGQELPVDHCQTGSHDCDVIERAICHYTGGSAYLCSCLPGYLGDGRVCEGEQKRLGECVCVCVCV